MTIDTLYRSLVNGVLSVQAPLRLSSHDTVTLAVQAIQRARITNPRSGLNARYVT